MSSGSISRSLGRRDGSIRRRVAPLQCSGNTATPDTNARCWVTADHIWPTHTTGCPLGRRLPRVWFFEVTGPTDFGGPRQPSTAVNLQLSLITVDRERAPAGPAFHRCAQVDRTGARRLQAPASQTSTDNVDILPRHGRKIQACLSSRSSGVGQTSTSAAPRLAFAKVCPSDAPEPRALMALHDHAAIKPQSNRHVRQDDRVSIAE
jgi:hypothetical protein